MRTLPFSYVSRSILREPSKFIQKVAGAAVVVFLVLGAGSFNRGMDRMLRDTGNPLNVLFIGAGSEESIERSEVPMRSEGLIEAGVRGISQRMGVIAVSGEVQYMSGLLLEDGSQGQGLLRGVTPRVFEVRREVRILEGRFPGAGEVMVGALAHHALGTTPEALALGKTVQFEGQDFQIAGRFDAPGTLLESEVWFTRSDLMTLTQRETLSCVLVRLERAEHFTAADLFSKQRLDLELVAIRESDYYDQLSTFYRPIRWMTWLTTALVAIGALFGGLNLLYASFAARIREFAALRTLGFTSSGILITLIQESLLTTLTGTWFALVAASILLADRVVFFSIGSFALTLDTSLLAMALCTGVALGVFGTLPPAKRCLGTHLPTALRSS
jgi:putative ABC transport system permease protein